MSLSAYKVCLVIGVHFYNVLVLKYMGTAANCPVAEVPLF